MVKRQDKKRKQDLGIFYTPQEVVDFIFEILKIWKNKEDLETKRWQSRKPQAHYPSVIDPACGEGIFLKKAVTSGFTGYHPAEKTPYVFGVDLDGEVVKRWEDISILHDLFKGNKKKMLNHFHKQNGLVELPDKVFNYKTGGLKEFDAVVGNPPYGGIGLGETELTDDLVAQLVKFEILPQLVRKSLIISDAQENLFTGKKDYPVKVDAKERIKSFSIETLFLDRFIQLAKPGGWIAIVIPDGILTNSNSDYVREFISRKTKIEVIVSLPRNTFKNAGTSAKTSILFLRKLKPDEKAEQDYPVFLSSLESINSYNFEKIVDAYQKFYNKKEKNMDKSQLVQITKDKTGREIVMVRADKTLKELMGEKPSSRWDPKYWHPQYDELYKYIYSHKCDDFGRFIKVITDGNRGERAFSKKRDEVVYIQATNMVNTGLDFSHSVNYVKKGSWLDPKRSRVSEDDILLGERGVASTGRVVVIHRNMGLMNISQIIALIRIKEINPFYIGIFLKSFFGQGQIKRLQSGIGPAKLVFDEIKSIKIPILSNVVQKNIESTYKKMSNYHDKAMDSKKKDDDSGYKTNLEIAEKMLNDLVARTEAVIRGERENIV